MAQLKCTTKLVGLGRVGLGGFSQVQFSVSVWCASSASRVKDNMVGAKKLQFFLQIAAHFQQS